MNIYAEFHARVAALLGRFVEAGRLPEGLDLGRFVVEPPRDPGHGDLAVNAAMVYAKEAKAGFGNPRQLATELAAALGEDADIAQAEVAGPGFLNIRLKPAVFGAILKSATIMFGEMLEPGGFDRAAAAAAQCDLMLAIGSTLILDPAA